VLTLDHAKSKSEDVTKDASNLQGFCARMGYFPQSSLLQAKKSAVKNRAYKTSLEGGGGALTGQIGGRPISVLVSSNILAYLSIGDCINIQTNQDVMYII
jgi:hypothetical protein